MGWAIIGGYVGYNYHRWENELLQLLNEKRIEKGLNPIKREDVSVYNYTMISKQPRDGPK